MKVLLIGAGAMGGAILRGCLDHQVWKKEDVLIKGRTAESSRRDAAAYGVSWSEDGHEAGEVDMVIVAVKPGVVPQVLKEIAPYHPGVYYPLQQPLRSPRWKRHYLKEQKSFGLCPILRLP